MDLQSFDVPARFRIGALILEPWGCERLSSYVPLPCMGPGSGRLYVIPVDRRLMALRRTALWGRQRSGLIETNHVATEPFFAININLDSHRKSSKLEYLQRGNMYNSVIPRIQRAFSDASTNEIRAQKVSPQSTFVFTLLVVITFELPFSLESC